MLSGLTVGYFWLFLTWNYSVGERAGWVQKFSKKGWVCKTWEGELSIVSMPGTTPEKFLFTVRDDSVADAINKLIGQRVSLHYEEKIGLPTTCFGETRHFVTKVTRDGPAVYPRQCDALVCHASCCAGNEVMYRRSTISRRATTFTTDKL